MCSWKVRFWKNENKVCSTWAGPSQRFWLNDILNTCFLACKTWIVSMYHQYWLYFCDYCNCIPHEFWNLMKDEFREKMCLKVWRSFLVVFFFFFFFFFRVEYVISSRPSEPGHSVHPPFCRGEGGGRAEPPTKFSKRGCLTGPQLLQGGCWKRERWLFSGRVAIFT